ncbi:hypothetical protein FA95DRAFT_1567648 [Auriscalpium vulgare]|uniref:Uncharacterized protein n=1 Tax=Auriscalpium vulgare TaxID=40419 RepID=A0ACB8R4A0_9AGAM|nr:hypothetical protein FA95DRAFT_1567648 [Auriscalpium vulgare]
MTFAGAASGGHYHVGRPRGHMRGICIVTGVRGPVGIPCADSGRPCVIPLPRATIPRSFDISSSTRRTLDCAGGLIYSSNARKLEPTLHGNKKDHALGGHRSSSRPHRRSTMHYGGCDKKPAERGSAKLGH